MGGEVGDKNVGALLRLTSKLRKTLKKSTALNITPFLAGYNYYFISILIIWILAVKVKYRFKT